MLVVIIAAALAVVLSVASAENSNCRIPKVDHGHVLEEYEAEFSFNEMTLQYDRTSVFIKMPVGRIVAPGNSYILSCYDGYVVQGIEKSEISCIAGKWLPEPLCVLNITCPRLITNNNLVVAYTNDVKVNSMAIFLCNSNSRLIVENSAICMPNGQWSNSRPICKSITCPRIIASNSLVVEYTNDVKVNSTAIFHCNPNTILIGENSAICMPNGEWSNSRPNCENITCPRIITSNSLVVAYTNNVEVNSTAIFLCNSNTRLIGENSAICMPNGQWSNSRPTCENPPCALDDIYSSLPPKAEPESHNFQYSTLPYNAEIALTCKEDLIVLGDPVAICEKNSTWKVHSSFHCSSGCPAVKQSPDSKLKVAPEKDLYVFGETVQFSCPFGMNLTTDLKQMKCLKNGWSEESFPDCAEKKNPPET